MRRIIEASELDRKTLFTTAAAQTRIPVEMIEKDFWVCWTLKKLFADPELKAMLRLKGGTSLSKIFHLIRRFSEDIDLILDWRCVTTDDPLIQRSNSKQDVFNKGIQEQTGIYIADTLCRKVAEAMAPECNVTPDSKDPHVLLIEYPESFPKSYITPQVRLEVGPLAAWIPNDVFAMKPYISDAFPELNIQEFSVPTILAERTFWEKVTILHQEHHRPEHLPLPLRYSRHYYDLYMMTKSGFQKKALARKDLLQAVVDFKKKFYPRGWAKYDLAVPGTVRLLPAEHSIKSLRDDYKAMRTMIFGDYPSWDDICFSLQKLEREINQAN